MSAQMCPPGIGDPNAKKIGTFEGSLAQQDAGLQRAVQSVREGLVSRQPGYVPFPTSTIIVAWDGTRIRGEASAASRTTQEHDQPVVRFILSTWNGNRLTWCIVDIDGDTITVEIHENLPDPANDWRDLRPVVLPPLTHAPTP